MNDETIAANKATVAAFCERLTTGDTQGVVDLMSDDVNYWILGRKSAIRTAGEHSKADMKRIFDIMRERMTGPLKFTAHSMIAEGSAVALEGESYGELVNGRVYNNRYHIRFTLSDGKITHAREYLDTLHAHEIWFAD